MLAMNKHIDFEQTFNGIECCSFIKDTESRYTFVNDAVCQLFGIEREQILGKTDTDFFDLKENNELQKNDQIVLNGTSVSKVEKNILKNKEIKYFQVMKSPLFDHNGCIHGLLGIAIDISESVEKSKELKFLAMHDPLTGAFNRSYLELHLQKTLSAHSRYKRKLSVMMIDIDSFKFINDNFGHTVGDTVLTEIGALLLKHTRDSDTCCRYGGDEFVIFLPDTSLSEAFLLAERIRTKVDNFQFFGSHKELSPLKVQVSIGISFLNNSAPNKLMQAADLALLTAKNYNKNTTMVNCETRHEIRSCGDCFIKECN